MPELKNSRVPPAPLGPPPHPWRAMLTDELHARPYGVVAAPARLFHLALLTGEATADVERRRLGALCDELRVAPPPHAASHFAARFPGFELTWERHTEFSTYTFVLPADGTTSFNGALRASLPSTWIDGLAGQTIAAIHVEILDQAASLPDAAALERVFAGANIVGGMAAGGRARLTN
jgi:uncharacterized membrane-anchored protein